MSIKALNWAFEQKVPTIPKFVLVVLADYADEKHSCFPSQEHIADITGIGKSTLVRAIQTLEKEGLVTRERRARSNGSRTSNRYFLQVGQSPGAGLGQEEPKSRSDTPQSPGAGLGQFSGNSDDEPNEHKGSEAENDQEPKSRSDTPLTSYPKVFNPKEDFGEPKPAPVAPEQRAAEAAYEAIGKAANFMALRGHTKWLIHDRGLTEELASSAIVHVYQLGKPITRSVLGQLIDGHLGSASRPSPAAQRRDETVAMIQRLQAEEDAKRNAPSDHQQSIIGEIL